LREQLSARQHHDAERSSVIHDPWIVAFSHASAFDRGL